MKKLLTGNEAIAEGIIESGVEVVCGYPGTPSTEVIQTLLPQAKDLGIHIEWSVNEKVAFEIAAAAAWAGKRALVTMKMSGVNVAVDSLSSIAYSGCTGGLIIFVADDPGANAGMPEEDSRHYAKSMVVPMLDLASQQECLDYVKFAFEISEKIGGPIFLRSTTDISHVASDVEIGRKLKLEKREAHFERNIVKYTKAASTWCMAQHQDALTRLAEASKITDSYITESGIKVNETHFEDVSKCGVIYAGAVEGNFKEALKKYNLRLSWLKIGIVHPLPEERIKEFLEKVDKVLILEELDPFIEAEVMRIAFLIINKKVKILGKFDKTLSLMGNYSFKEIKNALEALLKVKLEPEQNSEILKKAQKLEVKRPTSFCIGCPHRGTYYAINTAIKNLKYKKDEIIITGDIGCTILGMNKPFESCWTEVAMGASIGLAQGFKWAGIEKPVLATIGDSTFFHAGIPPLINAVYQKVPLTVVILDNGWTAMTGFEENPGTIHLNKANTTWVDIVEICQGCGVKEINVIDPYKSEQAIDIIMKSIKHQGVSVIVSRRECALQAKRRKIKLPKRKVNVDKCTGCRICLSSLSCPAMVFHPEEDKNQAFMEITSACFGCGLCEYTCPVGAIEVIKDAI